MKHERDTAKVEHNVPGWYFPDLEGPDLSTPIIKEEARAAELLQRFTVYEILDSVENDLTDDPVSQAEAEIAAAMVGEKTDA
jgi:hypothetical protein